MLGMALCMSFGNSAEQLPRQNLTFIQVVDRIRKIKAKLIES